MNNLEKKLNEKRKAVSNANQLKLPVYGSDGKQVKIKKEVKHPKLRKAAGITILTILVLFLILYVPGFFMKDKKETVSVGINTDIKIDISSVIKTYDLEDFDGDGLINADETRYGTSPYYIDTDGDGISDQLEITMTKTNPASADNGQLIKAQQELDKKNGDKVRTPYKIGNVILWADDYTSKAFGSVIEMESGFVFYNFSGYFQFDSKEKGDYAYYIDKKGIHKKLKYDSDADAYQIKPEMSWIYTTDDELSDIVAYSLFGHKAYKDANMFHKIAAFLLPSKGFFTAQRMTELDINDLTNVTATKIQEVSFDENEYTRFMKNHTEDIQNLQNVRETIKKDEKCVAVSLFSPYKGEYIGIVYGYDEGNLYVADKDTLKPVGKIKVTPMGKRMLSEDGTIGVLNKFRFEGLGFSSGNGDCINFFASSN